MKSLKSHGEWKILVSKYNESGLSIAKFCRENDLKSTTFIYWIKKYTPRNSDKNELVKIPLQVKIKAEIKIIVGDLEIKIPETLSNEGIGKLINTLREIV